MKLSILILLFLQTFSLLPANADQQEDSKFSNRVFDQKIKTVQLYKEGWNLSLPVISINSNEKLILNFDLLGDQLETYYYTFIHCTKDWTKSDIFTNDFLEGFPENQIEDVVSSFNTTVRYFHYRASFPNERINFKLSGNYIIIVYPADKPEEPVLTRRLILTENAAKINVTTHRPQMMTDNNTSQQVDFTVNFSGLNIYDPYKNLYAFILQNGRWDNAKQNLKPDVYGNNEIKYNSLSDRNIFRGGNEFRNFDIKSIRYQTEYVKKIDYLFPNYNVYLTTSENREFKPYFYSKDFNGKYFIAIQEGKDPNIDADYVNVYFTLPSKQIITGGNIYVSGGLNDWSFNKNNRMTYNQERGEYECTMQLKQGWYNYEFVFLKDGDTDGTASLFEGSHYETENDYLVLIYYRNPRERYDRAVGSVIANTLNRMSD
jgi:hypothetical protein